MTSRQLHYDGHADHYARTSTQRPADLARGYGFSSFSPNDAKNKSLLERFSFGSNSKHSGSAADKAGTTPAPFYRNPQTEMKVTREMSTTTYDPTDLQGCTAMVAGVTNLMNSLNSTAQSNLFPSDFPKNLMLTLPLPLLFAGYSEGDSEVQNLEMIFAQHSPTMVDAAVWIFAHDRAAFHAVSSSGPSGAGGSGGMQNSTMGPHNDPRLTPLKEGEGTELPKPPPSLRPGAKPVPTPEATKPEDMRDSFLSAMGRTSDEDGVHEGMYNEVRAFISEEFNLWTGEDITDVEGFNAKTTSTAHMASVLADAIADRITDLGMRHHYLQHMAYAGDQALVIRTRDLNIEAEKFSSSRVILLSQAGMAVKCASTEIRKVMDLVLHEVSDTRVKQLISKQRRMNMYDSGPLCHLLKLEGSYFGFGRQCDGLFQGHVTVNSINQRIDDMKEMTILRGTSVTDATAALVDTFHSIRKDEKIFPNHIQPLATARLRGAFCLHDVWRRSMIRSQTTNSWSAADFMIINQGVENSVQGMSEVRKIENLGMDEYASLVDTLLSDTAKLIDNDLLAQNPNRNLEESDVSEESDDGQRHRGRKNDRSSRKSTRNEKSAKTAQGSKARRSARRRATSPNGEYAALFNNSGGRLCAYCNLTKAGRMTDGRKEAPHGIKNCANKCFDKILGQLGANATPEYRAHAESRGVTVTQPSSRTQSVPTGTPCALTQDEYRDALRKKKMPSSTEYVAPGNPGTSSDPNKALMTRIAALEASSKTDREDLESRVKAAEERAMLAEQQAKTYRKLAKTAGKKKSKESSRKRDQRWEVEEDESSESSSSSESDSE